MIQKYSVKRVLHSEYYHVEYHHVFHTLEKTLQFIEENRFSKNLIEVTEYYLVHTHPFYLPPADGYDEFTEKSVYNAFYKIPEEIHTTVKQKDYKDKFLENQSFNNYCIEYEFLQKHEFLNQINVGHACYDTKDNNRRETMKAFYSHTKSRQYFNVSLYQYAKCDIKTFIEKNNPNIK